MTNTADQIETPRKPIAISNGGHGVCPRCENLVSHSNIPHCKWCGQALKWPDETNGG